MVTDAIKKLAAMGHTAMDKVERLLAVEAQLNTELADLKEQAAIMDSLHKETMERLERYEKALEEIAEESCGEMAGYEMQRFARATLGK